MKRSFSSFVYLGWLLMFLPTGRFVLSSAVIEDDFKCLEGVKNSLNDPDRKLSSWTFKNNSVGFPQNFVGVSLWNEMENRVFSLQLKDMKLSGQLPQSLEYCSRSLQILDLSGNKLSGIIPPHLCDWLPYLVTLNLSSNNLHGPIPPELSKCIYLNHLILSNNKLSGSIPYQISFLGRLKNFSVANNDLTGAIPPAFENYNKSYFVGNSCLCGGPLGKCGTNYFLSKKNLDFIILFIIASFGAAVSLLMGLTRRKKKLDDSGWVEMLKAHKWTTQVLLFRKPLKELVLADLMKATNNFSRENIVISTRTGSSYKGMLADGSALLIKRLKNCKLDEKEFRKEMDRLGKLRHPNLTPFLGYCTVVGTDHEEKLLVYKQMPNGNLFSLLHGSSSTANIDWPTRFRIGLGAARGLDWLHHRFNPPFPQHNICSRVIFADDDFNARIIDFGFAGLMNKYPLNVDFAEFGYVAPEYYSSNNNNMVASLKGDVYGFGVVLLELVTRRKPLKVNLVNWVNRLSNSGRIKDAIDRAIYGKGHDEEIMHFLEIASHCVVAKPDYRWSMHQVYQSLKSMAEENGTFFEEFDERFYI